HSSRDPASAWSAAGSEARSVVGGGDCLRTSRATMTSHQTKTTMVSGCFTTRPLRRPRVAGDSADRTRYERLARQPTGARLRGLLKAARGGGARDPRRVGRVAGGAAT